MPLNKVVQPAFKLAREGFIVNDALADELQTYGSEVIAHHENRTDNVWKKEQPPKTGTKSNQR
ncbi:gamma-glutamyltranspeptidase [Escherichia coli]|nr:gamma-glutamyltranspeptidase [Escherichia coli]